jgi:trans-2,3-dihydro-3-hydroxyanthranilate isomerase
VPGSLYLFTRETRSPSTQLHVRLFAHVLGIPEDPATGSAAGCLAAYAAEYRYLGAAPLAATIEQGLEMARPSRLHVRAEAMDGRWAVQVGGHAVIIASGELG